jgi:putative lipoprotein
MELLIKKIKTMKTKRFINGLALAFSAVMTMLFVACNPEQPENEKENKLHEDPVRAVFTLQEGTLDNASAFDNTPKMANFKAASVPAQVIEWETTAGQGWHVTSATKSFNVKNSVDNPSVVYLLKMEYYNAKGEMMNSQFYNLGQDKIHQHFFSMFKQVMYEGQMSSVRVTNKAELPYDYRYIDELNGTFIGDTNPMGFQGLIKFVKPGREFTLSVDLLHAAGSKFGDDGKASPFYNPAGKLLSTGLWDINVKLPIVIDGQSTEQSELDPSLINPAKAVIEIYNGHLHGPHAFHQNPTPKELKYIGRNYKLTYTLENGKWVADPKNGKSVNLMGSSQDHYVSAFVIHYYDKAGNEITSQIVNNGEDSHYQHFFMVDDIRPSYGGKKEATDVNSTEFFDYVYCDTDPWNKTNKFDGAKFTGQSNPIGHKGYFKFLRTHKQFNLEIRLMRARNSKLTNGKASSFCAPTARQLKEEAWLPTIVVPMNIYMDSDERELDSKVYDTDYDKLSDNAKDYSESNLVSIRSLMDAFGITDIKTAVLDFWWNFHGDSKHSDAGFWF